MTICDQVKIQALACGCFPQGIAQGRLQAACHDCDATSAAAAREAAVDANGGSLSLRFIWPDVFPEPRRSGRHRELSWKRCSRGVHHGSSEIKEG